LKITYDPQVDALYIRFFDEPIECEVIRLNETTAINIGPKEKLVGVEILDASEMLLDIKEQKIQLENLTAV